MSCKILSVVRVRPFGAHSHNLFRIAIVNKNILLRIGSLESSFFHDKYFCRDHLLNVGSKIRNN